MKQVSVQIEWKEQSYQNGIEYLKILAGYFSSVTSLFKYNDHDGFDTELTFDEAIVYLDNGIIQELILEISSEFIEGNTKVQFIIEKTSLQIRLPLNTAPDCFVQRQKDFLWLQNNHSRSTVLPVIALPKFSGQLHFQATQTLIALASQICEISSATVSEIKDDKTSIIGQWYWVAPKESSGKLIPVVSQFNGSFWFAEAIKDTEDDEIKQLASFWYEPLLDVSKDELFKEIKQKIEAACAADQSISPINEILSNYSLFSNISCIPIETIIDKNETLVATNGQNIAIIDPDKNGIQIGFQETLPEDLRTQTILQCLAHILLGHVKQGDTHSYHISQNNLTRWDEKIIAAFPEWFELKENRRTVESLDECTPREKAMLGLWKLISDKLGDHQQLHDKAIAYQQAAYQRQAAERLLAQLEQFSGAMLCDGVGLGKTYVATTLITHYVNSWLDNYSGNEDPKIDDPFRITILAPNSIVSTWKREAISPLSEFGVITKNIRVISHSKLSRISAKSAILKNRSPHLLNDFEHLVFSDLVIVDEAHNFRSTDAKRTLVLRDLLRLQPRNDIRRKVLLLTATPINNSLDDLKQESSLLFCEGLPLSENITPDKYKQEARKKIRERCQKAAKQGGGDIANYLIHNDRKAKFSQRIFFRDDLHFSPSIPRISDYLKEQDKLLKELQDEIRLRNQNNEDDDQSSDTEKELIPRIADEYLDRIVVQRSRNLCKEIEKQQNSKVELLFRPDAKSPEKLYYSDEYDGTEDVLAKFLPLFDTAGISRNSQSLPPLSLKVYMWYDISRGTKTVDEPSSVVGLQRALVLKRLESSPVAFLITLLRLSLLYAMRLYDLYKMCSLHNRKLKSSLEKEIDKILAQIPDEALQKLLLLVGKENSDVKDFVKVFGRQYAGYSESESIGDLGFIQTDMFSFIDDENDETSDDKEKLDRIWTLKDYLLTDFQTLLQVTPNLTDLILGKFDTKEWPKRFHAEKAEVQWPQSATWGKRIVTDPKLKRLVERLLVARRQKQKVIVFSQFTDSLVYVYSVLNACRKLTLEDFEDIIKKFEVHDINSSEIFKLLKTIEIVTGETEDREEVVNRFAPYYRLNPTPPKMGEVLNNEDREALESWKKAWEPAISHPIEVLFSSDVLAEGVNLQDASVLINWDVHWNPVRMIQRSGRIDRRLNPGIESKQEWKELNEIAKELNKEIPPYYWHEHTDEPPLTINMILPDELERELLLRERIATKTLAIDFTLGLEHGTGAEADWMAQYKYQGVSSLNAWQKDRAIEQIASYKEKINKYFTEVSIKTDWLENLRGWFFEEGSKTDTPLIGAISEMGKKDGEKETFTRFISPVIIDEKTYWLWTTENPGESIINFWIDLDGKTWPPKIRTDIPWRLNASLQLSADHLLTSVNQIIENKTKLAEKPLNEYARSLRQGVTAFSAGYFAEESDRKTVGFKKYFILQHKFQVN